MYNYNNMIRKCFIAAVVCVFFSVNAYSQETDTTPELITDRPDATEAPSVVPKGSFQAELGGFYESFDENGIKTESYTYNTTLLRYGLLDRLELRLGWDIVDQKITDRNLNTEQSISGFSPLLAGVKVAITEEKGCLPEIGLIGHLMLPFTAGSDVKPETTGVDFRFAFAHTLSDRSSLSYNLGAEWGNDSPEAAYIYTLAYGYAITDAFGAYVELYGDFPENSMANHLWDAGITYLVQHNIQLDATVGTSFTDGQDILLSAGISFRIPN